MNMMSMMFSPYGELSGSLGMAPAVGSDGMPPSLNEAGQMSLDTSSVMSAQVCSRQGEQPLMIAQSQQILNDFAFRQQMSSIIAPSNVSPSSIKSATLNHSTHTDPFRLDGFSLDGPALTARHSSSPTSSRKRKELASDVEVDSTAMPLRKKSKGKSLFIAVPANLHRTDSQQSSGATSPLLALMQESSAATTPTSRVPSPTVVEKAPLSKAERAELKRHRKTMKLLKLEKSIAALQAQIQATQQVELVARHRAAELAHEANMVAAVTCEQYLCSDSESSQEHSHSHSPQSSENGSLPPLSPLELPAAVPMDGTSPVMNMVPSETVAASTLTDSNQSTPIVGAYPPGLQSLIVDDAESRLRQLLRLQHACDLMDQSMKYVPTLSTIESCLSDSLTPTQVAALRQMHQDSDSESEMGTPFIANAISPLAQPSKEWNQCVHQFTQAFVKQSHAQSNMIQRLTRL